MLNFVQAATLATTGLLSLTLPMAGVECVGTTAYGTRNVQVVALEDKPYGAGVSVALGEVIYPYEITVKGDDEIYVSDNDLTGHAAPLSTLEELTLEETLGLTVQSTTSPYNMWVGGALGLDIVTPIEEPVVEETSVVAEEVTSVVELPVVVEEPVVSTPILHPTLVDPTLMTYFMEVGYSYEKSVGLSYAYSYMSNMFNPDGTPYFSENVKIAVLCNICREGVPGMFELPGEQGSKSAKHWGSSKITSSQRMLAGVQLSSPNYVLLGNTIDPTTSIGCGMLQWTAGRRFQLFNNYLTSDMMSKEYISVEDFAKVEATFICTEFLDYYYRRILTWCNGKDLNYCVRKITQAYVGQADAEEQNYRLGYIPTVQSALALYNQSSKGKEMT